MKRKKYMRISGIVLCVAVLCSISFMLGGAAKDLDIEDPVNTEIVKEFDAPMSAWLFNADGELQKTFSLTIDGSIDKVGNETQLNFLIHIPTEAKPEINWKYEALNEGHMRPLPWESKYYVWHYYCFDYANNKYESVTFALCTEKQYLIACWNDGEAHTLVAAADPEATAEDIREYFSYFIDKYAAPFSNQQE